MNHHDTSVMSASRARLRTPWRVTRWLCWLGSFAAMAATSSVYADEPRLTSTSVVPASMASALSEGDDEQGVVNLNEASAAELMRLPGVGEKRAQAILDLRQRLDGFKRLAQIMRVKGIGRKTFRRLRPMLTLEGPTTLR